MLRNIKNKSLVMGFTKNFKQLTKKDVGIAGGKGASLGEMTKAGIPVPPGFVVLASAFEQFIKETDVDIEIESELKKVNHQDINSVEEASERIRAVILKAKMPKDIGAEIMSEFKKLKPRSKPHPRPFLRKERGFFVSVRSSATA